MEAVKIHKIEKLGEKAYPIKGLVSIQYGDIVLQGFKIFETDGEFYVVAPFETIHEGSMDIRIRCVNFPKSLWDKVKRAILIAWEEQKDV